VLCRKSQARCKIFGRSLARGTFLRAASSSAFIVSEQKAKYQNLRRGGVDFGSLIIRKIAEFAKPVDLAENTVYDPRANYRAPQATIKTPPET
jgi:hypothetical protein